MTFKNLLLIFVLLFFSGFVGAQSSRTIKADSIESNAPSGNIDITSPIKLNSSTAVVNDILDEDDMATDSATAFATQQSIKAYVDASVISVGGLGDVTISSTAVNDILKWNGSSWINSATAQLDTLTVDTTVTAVAFVGDGSQLTGIVSSNVTTLTASVQENTDNLVTVTASVQENTDNLVTVTASVQENTDNLVTVTASVQENTDNLVTVTASVQENTDNLVTVTASFPLYALLDSSPTFTGTVTASSFSGDGSNLTGLSSGFADPMTGDGDIISRVSGSTTRIAPGTEGQVLTSHGAASDLTWETPSGGGSGITWSIVTTDTTVSANNGYIANVSDTATPVKFYLPTTMATGDFVSIAGLGNDGWELYTGTGAQSLTYEGESTSTATESAYKRIAYSTEDWGHTNLITIEANTKVMPINYYETNFAVGIPYYSGITAHWKLDELSAVTTMADSFASNDLVKINSPTYSVEGIFLGGSYTFPSTTLMAAYHAEFNSSSSTKITLECWMKLTASIATAQEIFMNTSSTSYTPAGTDLLFRILDSGTGTNLLAFGGASNTNQARYTYTSKIDDEWHYVVGVIDLTLGTDRRKLYVDGAVVGTNNDVSTFPSANGWVAIGGPTGANSSFTTGKINEVVYWNGTAMTQAQVTARYNSGVGKPYY